MLNGQTSTRLLTVSNGSVSLCDDRITKSYSIGIGTDEGVQVKFISKELHDLLVKELANQEGLR